VRAIRSMRLARTLSSKNVIAAVNFSCAIRLAANGFLVHDIEIQTRSCTPWRFVEPPRCRTGPRDSLLLHPIFRMDADRMV